MRLTDRQFLRLAWITLGYAVAVIIWGAVVRATGSGAGCGAHWPLCNGEVVPLAPRVQTVIEFAHRTTSGLILVLTGVLLWAARASYPTGHAARRAAGWSMVFVLIEAAVGAGIVLLRLVEDNASALRAGYIAAHLANTLVLVGMYTWTVHAAIDRTPAWMPDAARRRRPWYGVALLGMIVVAAAGAIVALGDTLFPVSTLGQGLAADRDPAAHFLIRLRMWHPLLAVTLTIYVLSVLWQSDAVDEAAVARPARLAQGLILGQVALGVVNIVFLAPLWLQMLHLAVSNLLWVALVWIWLAARGPKGPRLPSAP